MPMSFWPCGCKYNKRSPLELRSMRHGRPRAVRLRLNPRGKHIDKISAQRFSMVRMRAVVKPWRRREDDYEASTISFLIALSTFLGVCDGVT